MLYQYFKFEDGRNYLESQLLKISIPNRINDPFEFLPQYVKTNDLSIIKEQALQQDISNMLINKFNKDTTFISEFGHMNLDRWPFWVNDNIQSLYNFYCISFEYATSSQFSNYIDDLSKKLGLICFTAKNDSILMWSHYAKNHTGIVIGFKNNLFDGKAIQVKYSDKRVQVRAGFKIIDKNEFEQVLYNKNIDWAYEDEYRLCMKLDSCLRDGDNYYMPCPIEMIKEIYFGVNCKYDHITYINSLLNQNIDLYQCARNWANYNIDFKKL